VQRIGMLGVTLIFAWACCGSRAVPVGDYGTNDHGGTEGRRLDRDSRVDRRMDGVRDRGWRFDRILVFDGRQKCGSSDECTDQLCIGGYCQYATSCCQIHSLEPQWGDGEYWLIDSGGWPIVAYCDMRLCDRGLAGELCSVMEGDHEGRTRDGSQLAYLMRSLLTDQGTCEIWALRGKSDNHPLDGLGAFAGQTLKTCQALGFVDDDRLGACLYGSNPGNGNCGFPGSLYRYGNHCTGCTLNDGFYPSYVLQGPMYTANVITAMDGTSRTRCKTR
jgi:hypothetical protein